MVAIDVDGNDLVVEEVEQGDVGGLAGELRGGPLAVESPGGRVVGRVGDVHGARRDRRRVEGDRVEPVRARLGDRRVHRVAVRGDHDALVTGGDRVVDRGDLGRRVAVGRARRYGQAHPELGGVGLCVGLHRDEVRVRERFQDQRDLDLACGRGAPRPQAHRQHPDHSEQRQCGRDEPGPRAATPKRHLCVRHTGPLLHRPRPTAGAN